MSETEKQANQGNQAEEQPAQAFDMDGQATDNILKTAVDKETVVNFIEGMMQAMGTSMLGQLPENMIRLPAKTQPQSIASKFQSKVVANIMRKLERLNKYPDTYKEVMEDAEIAEWLQRSGCKQRDYYEELELAQELTSCFGGYRRYDLAIQAAKKAVNITVLHHRDDEETLTELNWVLADLHAAADNMPVALDYLNKTVALVEPGAGEGSATYNELLAQLNETNARSRMLVNA